MREQGSGSIVGVSSQSGRFVMPTNAAYCATKYAMEAALETLSLEVGRFGIRVVIVEPGLTFTAAMEKNVPWPEGTPYESVYRRTGAIFSDEASEGSEAEPVAEPPSPTLLNRQMGLCGVRRWAGCRKKSGQPESTRRTRTGWICIESSPTRRSFRLGGRILVPGPEKTPIEPMRSGRADEPVRVRVFPAW